MMCADKPRVIPNDALAPLLARKSLQKIADLWVKRANAPADTTSATKNAVQNTGSVGLDDPITLKEACQIAFRNRVKIATLRAEAARGNLITFRIGNKDFTTLRHIREMNERKQVCQPARKVPGFTSTRKDDNGLSDTDNILSARGA